MTAASTLAGDGRSDVLSEAGRKLADALTQLADTSTGGVSRLKRGAGKRLRDADVRAETLTEFYRLLPGSMPGFALDAGFLVATLFPLTKRDSPRFGNLGATLRACRTNANAAGLRRRLEALLDADTAQLSYRLRRAIQYAASREPPGPVNWAQLFADVARWRSPETQARVRREWAEAYFVGHLEGPAKARQGATPEAPEHEDVRQDE